MSRGEREGGPDVAGEEERALLSRLEDLADAAGEAMNLLAEMGAGLFPSGQPDISRLTWSERGDAVGAPPGPEELLRRTELRFRTLIEQIPAVTFLAVLGEGKNEIYVSPHIEALLGYGQREWLSDPFLWYARLHPDDRAVWNDEFARGCRTGGPFRAECRFLARDGRAVWVHGEARLVKDERGRPLFLQGVAFDITEIKAAQQALVEAAVRRAKAEEELAIARRVQLSIIPRSFAVEGLEIAARMDPASDVGGDYYDVLPAKDGAWIAVGDVSGHGLPSGLIMLMLQSAVAAAAKAHAGATPREVLCLVNEVLYENIRKRLTGDDHVTLSLLRYERSGRLLVAGAHEDILVSRRRTGRVEMIRPPGTWIGARRDISSVTVDTEIALEDGDLVVLYTDGATEAMDGRGRQFDIDRLVAAVQEARAEAPARVVERLFAAVRGWMRGHEQADDISVLAFRYRAPS